MAKTLNVYQVTDEYKQKHGIQTDIINDSGSIYAKYQSLGLVKNNATCPKVVPLEFNAIKQKFTVPRGYK